MSVSRKLKSRLKQAPVILISPVDQAQGVEFGDLSISLSESYQHAVWNACGLPLILPAIASRELIAESVRRCDGILLTGGDDIQPRLYTRKLPAQVMKTIVVEPGERDLRELMLVDEVFRQQKPLLGICRGHQLINVALGGTLIADIPSQVRGAINHKCLERKSEVVQEARLTGDSMLARIAGKQRLGINSTHHQAIGRLARLLRVTAICEDGVVEATELKAEAAHLLPFLVTVQYHPERLARFPEHQELFNCFARACVVNRNSKL